MAYTSVGYTPGSGTSTAIDRIGGVDYQRIKQSWGVEGAAVDISALNPLPVSAAPPVFTFPRITTADTNAVTIKNSPARLKSVHIFNNAAYPIFVKFHNLTTTPTAGTGVVFGVGCQAGVARDVVLPDGGRDFTTGLGMTVVRGIALTDATAVALNDGQIEVGYV